MFITFSDTPASKKIRWANTFTILLSLLVLAASPARASETRVDSMGGQTSTIDDETNNLDLFLDGNPAGLVLLQTQDRFDISGQWGYSNSQPSGPGSVEQSFSTIARLSDDSIIHYGGLMIFSHPWALQVDSDVLSNQNLLAANYSLEPENTQQYRQLIRAAFDAGIFAFGLEFSNVENDQTFNAGLYNSAVTVQSGASGENQTRVRIGVITTFPDDLDDDDPRWQTGFVFETYLGQVEETLNNNVFYTSLFTLQQNTATTNYYYFGPELHYEIPGTLIVRFSSFMTNYDTSFLQTVSQTNAQFAASPTSHISQYQTMTNTGVFHLTLPTSATENFKLGGSFTAILTNNDFIGTGSAEDVYFNADHQQLNGILGAGFESLNHYFWGLQLRTQNYIQDNQAAITTTPTLTTTDYDLYQVALGGEKWLTPHFALRASLIGEMDIYSQSITANVLNTSGTVGFGLKDKGFNLDTKFLLGKEVDFNNSAESALLLDAEISGTFFL